MKKYIGVILCCCNSVGFTSCHNLKVIKETKY